MTFHRDALPDPITYFEKQGLKLVGPSNAKWRTTECRFHGGSDSMRVNVQTGGWCCMSCGEKGGDVLAYHMQAHSMTFIRAAMDLGAWSGLVDPQRNQPAPPLTAREALAVLSFEALVVAIVAAQVTEGRPLSVVDRARAVAAAARINKLAEVYA